MTALAEAMQRAGGPSEHEAELAVAVARFQNNGGTYAQALSVLRAAWPEQFASPELKPGIFSSFLKERGGGRITGADNSGLIFDAAASPTNDDGEGRGIHSDKAGGSVPSLSSPERSAGQLADAEKAARCVPSAAPPRTGAGFTTDADKAVPFVPASGSPRFRPGHAKRGIAAIAAVQETVARSLFDTTRLPDGRSLREVHWAEVPQLASRYTFLSRVMTAVHQRGVPADPAATLDELVTEDQLKEIIGAVERLNDIH